MNVKLSFSPVSQQPGRPPRRRARRREDPARDRRRRGLRPRAAGRRRLPRQDPEARVLRDPARGSEGEGRGRLLEPAAQELEPLGEREDLRRAGDAPRARLPPGPRGTRAEHEGRCPPRREGGRGRRPRHPRLRQVQAGEGRLLREGGLAHDPRSPRPPGRRRGAQGPLRVGRRERQPRARPDQRARQRGDARVDRGRGGGARPRGGARGRGARPGRPAREGLQRHPAGGGGQRATRAAWSCCATSPARPRRRRSPSSARASPSTPAASA